MTKLFDDDSIEAVDTVIDYLNDHVIGQDEAKRQLGVLAALYLNRCMRVAEGVDFDELPPINIFITGPTGSGKTYMLRKLADCLGVPFVRIDCSSLSQQGWDGLSLGDALLASELKTTDSIASVIMLDEMDKLGLGAVSSKGTTPHLGIQNNLLDLLDGKYTYSTKQHFNEVIKNSLVLCSGSFEDVRKQLGKQKPQIGFKHTDSKEGNLDCWKAKMTEAGLIPELVGRIVDVIELQALTDGEIEQLLKRDLGIYHQYKTLLPEFHLNENVIQKMVQQVKKSKYGLREINTLLFKETCKQVKKLKR